MANEPSSRHWVLLSGGVGGAKLALGLDALLPSGALTVIANTGDDFAHLGLAICPDLDTLTYTLGGVVNPDTGWGRRDETWSFMAALGELGGETWFRLGDRDLALHVERTRRLAAGETLTAVTHAFCARFGVRNAILPMCDEPAPTTILADTRTLSFQQYFVREQAQPRVTGFRYAGAGLAPGPGVLAALADPLLAGIFIAPSNPWLSIEPVLALPALRAALRDSRAPVIAVSPIVAGAALKGPTAKIMRELGVPVTALSVARHYGGLLDGFVLDEADAGDVPGAGQLGIAAIAAPTVMRSLADRTALAARALGFAAQLGQHGAPR